MQYYIVLWIFLRALYLQLPASIIFTSLLVYTGLILNAKYGDSNPVPCIIKKHDQVNCQSFKDKSEDTKVVIRSVNRRTDNTIAKWKRTNKINNGQQHNTQTPAISHTELTVLAGLYGRLLLLNDTNIIWHGNHIRH